MREIKFRAWIKDYEVMVTVDFIDFIEGEIMIIDHEGIQRIFTLSEVELMQYTGLKDIKGKDIYHGDLCLYDRNINERLDKKVFVVEYQDGAFFIDSDYERVYLHDIKQTQEEVEVIGNIHENPELLEDKP